MLQSLAFRTVGVTELERKSPCKVQDTQSTELHTYMTYPSQDTCFQSTEIISRIEIEPLHNLHLSHVNRLDPSPVFSLHFDCYPFLIGRTCLGDVRRAGEKGRVCTTSSPNCRKQFNEATQIVLVERIVRDRGTTRAACVRRSKPFFISDNNDRPGGHWVTMGPGLTGSLSPWNYTKPAHCTRNDPVPTPLSTPPSVPSSHPISMSSLNRRCPFDVDTFFTFVDVFIVPPSINISSVTLEMDKMFIIALGYNCCRL